MILLSTVCCVMSCQVGGLQLEGCTFDGNTLSENQRDSSSVAAIPTATIAWVPKVRPLHWNIVINKIKDWCNY